jgi:hypothetical protein
MAPLQKPSIDSREAFPGVINVTPVPIETPIHTRPVLQSHPLIVNTILTHTSTKVSHPGAFHWGAFILLVFLAALFGVILSKWGWTKITGQIWKTSSGWDGPLEDEEEGELLTNCQAQASTPKINLANIQVIPSESTESPQITHFEWITKS